MIHWTRIYSGTVLTVWADPWSNWVGLNELRHKSEHFIILHWSELYPRQLFSDRSSLLQMLLLGFLIDLNPPPPNQSKTWLTPGEIYPIKCQFHALFFPHWLCQSLWNPAASLPQLLYLHKLGNSAAPPLAPLTVSPLMPTQSQSTAKI